MEKTKNMKVDSIEAKVAEPKAEFTEDPDEAWLDDLVFHLYAMEHWNYQKNASKVLMEDPLCKMPSRESHWDQTLFWYPTILCLTDVPPQENTEPGAVGSAKVEAENPGTQTKGKKTTRDAGIQVCINTAPLKGSTLSGGKQLANCK